jgi:hypothetical protein
MAEVKKCLGCPIHCPKTSDEGIDLNIWKLTLPTPIGVKKSPDEITLPALLSYQSEYFKKTASEIQFFAPVNGCHTPNSKYPRSELREMLNGKNASWDLAKGKHVMEYVFSVLQLPEKKSEIVVGQIHGVEDDVFEILVSPKGLTIAHNNLIYGELLMTVFDKKFRVLISCEKGVISIEMGLANEVPIVRTDIKKPAETKGLYFKVGCYTQANEVNGSGAGKCSVYAVKVSHQ